MFHVPRGTQNGNVLFLLILKSDIPSVILDAVEAQNFFRIFLHSTLLVD